MVRIKLRFCLDKENAATFLDLYTIVDDEFEELAKLEWWARMFGNRLIPTQFIFDPTTDRVIKSIPLHRLIMNNPEGMDVHHKNGNTLDNRKENLQIMTKLEHARLKKRPKKLVKQYSILVPYQLE